MLTNVSTAVRVPRAIMTVAAGAGVLFAATVLLWAYYGTAVFLELVRAGWAACF